MKNRELKNCPCCGSDNLILKEYSKDESYRGPAHKIFLIKCKNKRCGITTGQHKKKETVLRIWNRRENE